MGLFGGQLYIDPSTGANTRTVANANITHDLGLAGNAARTFGMERTTTASTAGFGLTINAGGAVSAGTNLAGGDLTFAAGVGTGTGKSDIIFKASPGIAAATADNTLSELMRITGGGNVGVGTSSPSATMHIQKNAIGATSTDGLLLANSTAATSGVQEYAPRLHFNGQGWKSSGPSGSKPIDWTVEAIPVSGSANPTSLLNFSSSINGSAYSSALILSSDGSVGVGTTTPSGKLDINQGTAGSVALQAQKTGTYYWKVSTPTNAIGTAWNAASAVQYVGSDTTTGRSINAAGTINASGADFAEWVDWSGPKPEMGSIVFYKGSYVVVSSPFIAAFVGNDVNDHEHSILVAFAGQLPVLVTGTVQEGNIIVANGDCTGRAVPRTNFTTDLAKDAVGIAWESSGNAGLKRIKVAVGRNLGAAKDPRIDQLESENIVLKQRLDGQQKELEAIKRKLGL